MTQQIDIESYFAEDGVLAQKIRGFRPRAQQLEMAQAIYQAIRTQGVLVAEAGTGTGKTYAYLVPALLAGGKVILSTGTKTLQDQLFHRDLPTIRGALKVPVTIALLKGRANYVCHYHLERAHAEGRFLTRDDASHIRIIKLFAQTSKTGDKAECTQVPEDSTAWHAATSTRDNCLGQECPNAKECFVMQARRQAQDADVVVVNHHLFFADVVLRDEGMTELLPAANTVIFDEAHQLPETASLFFGQSVSTGQLLELARDMRVEALAHARDFAPLQEATRTLEKATRDLRLAMPNALHSNNGPSANADKSGNVRYSMLQLQNEENFTQALTQLDTELKSFVSLAESQAERGEGLQKCWQRATEIHTRLQTWRGEQAALGEESIRWAEVFSQTASLNTTPLHVAEIFRKQLQDGPPKAWIFASATLAVGRDFAHYSAELGLDGLDKPPQTQQWGSPFDYPTQSVLYVPESMPDPNSPAYLNAVFKAALPAICAARGRTFVLCTSLRAMQKLHDLLEAEFAKEQIGYPLLLQGQGTRTELLERFRKLGNAVLVASHSFWEGVDVPGDALSLVIIDKLPFAPPDDPVLKARVDHLEKQGRNPFMEYQLPRTIISMKQGAGRLIRTEQDRGVLMLCDPRVITKPYGRRIWQSLPPMRRTRKAEEVEAFLGELRSPVESESK